MFTPLSNSLTLLLWGLYTLHTTPILAPVEEIILPPAVRHVRDVMPPENYQRVATEEGSYAAYIQNLVIKEDTTIYLHNGEIKPDQSFGYLVIDMDIGEKNLQQCADAAIRLRAEYLYAQKRFQEIRFNFTNGQTAYYEKWREGYRASLVGYGNRARIVWEKKAEFEDSYESFRNYLNLVFNYAGSWSLDKELETVTNLEEVEVGDMLVRGAFPGHVMIIVDIARHQETGEKLILLAQSARPAQDIHIVKNRHNLKISPWYSIYTLETKLDIEEWTFYKENLKRF